ncbi:MAG: hypothetical protein U9N00_05695, partial [Candidatus Bipolaricaulota bacterium]|nr:hypothetical protein [Candidatus Bipolaricaulota bacterium]
MSKNTMVVAVVALLLAALALVLPFILPASEGGDEVALNALGDRITSLENSSSAPLKIAYLNAEDAFSVFTDAVSDLRQKAVDKQMEIAKLQQDFMAGTISKDEYQNTNNRLQVELLQAQLNIDVGTIDKMI